MTHLYAVFNSWDSFPRKGVELGRMVKETRSHSELDSYVCGGYFIVKPASNSGPVEFCEICKTKLPPGEIVTLSTCLTVTLPHGWAYEKWINIADEERRQRAQIWGLRDSDLNEFIKWTTDRQSAGEIGYPNALRTLDTARDLLQRFPISRNGCKLLGLGLRRDNAASFVAEYAPTRENELLPVIAEAINRELALDPSGHIIGYEVLGWEVDGFHSWFCSLSEEDVPRGARHPSGPRWFARELRRRRDGCECCGATS